MKKYIIALSCLLVLSIIGTGLFVVERQNRHLSLTELVPSVTQYLPSITPTPNVQVKTPPDRYVIPSASYVGQTFNNCGPATLSMVMSYFGTQVSQDELREQMRPFNNPAGGVDDKSVFAAEFVEYAQKYGFESVARPNGDLQMLKKLIANDIPVVLRTWLHPNEDIGHFRIVRGYDDARQVFIQDDSYEGRNLEYAYTTFDEMWKPFNYGYILVYPKDKADIVAAIVGENMDEKVAYTNAKTRAEANLGNNPNSAYDLFNLSTAYFHLDDMQKSVEYYERAQAAILPARMLWYQIEPLQAYGAVGDHERVFALTDWIIRNNNVAFSEMYILRGKSYQAQGNIDAARAEFEKAVYYNKNLTTAKEALNIL
ncbi:MAG TPA: C39 family peptidase [Candidatus Levybacteria bacterium]|nr:C39 family peptidase [Candidatus Levybacteria bacterium]